MQTAFSIFLLFSSTKQMSVRDCQIWVPLKKKRFLECFLGHLPFWVSGVEAPLIFYTKKKKKTKYNYTRLNCSISLIE